MCDFFVEGNNNRSSIIASQYFLLCKYPNISLMYDCQIEGEIFNPIGILWYQYDLLSKYGNILQYLFKFSENLCESNASFISNTNRTSHQELPNTENVCFSNGYNKLFFAVITFKCLKSVILSYLV